MARILTLAKQNPLVFAQIVLYFIAWLSGFFIVIPMGYQIRDFHGSCILFSQVIWGGRFIWPWADATCEYVLYANLAINVFFCSFMLIFFLVVVWPKTASRHYEKVEEVEKWSVLHVMTGINPVFCLVNTVIVLLLLGAGSTLSAGFARWCNWLMAKMEDEGIELTSCYAAQSDLPWDQFRIRGGTTMGVNGGRFFDNMITAIIFSWINVVVWIMQLAINFSKVCRRCSCEVAEEKKKYDKSMIIAARRSRMATPIGTPGGGPLGPPMGASMPQPYRPVPQQPPPQQYGRGQPMPQQYGQLNPQSLMGAPPPQHRGGTESPMYYK